MIDTVDVKARGNSDRILGNEASNRRANREQFEREEKGRRAKGVGRRSGEMKPIRRFEANLRGGEREK